MSDTETSPEVTTYSAPTAKDWVGSGLIFIGSISGLTTLTVLVGIFSIAVLPIVGFVAIYALPIAGFLYTVVTYIRVFKESVYSAEIPAFATLSQRLYLITNISFVVLMLTALVLSVTGLSVAILQFWVVVAAAPSTLLFVLSNIIMYHNKGAIYASDSLIISHKQNLWELTKFSRTLGWVVAFVFSALAVVWMVPFLVTAIKFATLDGWSFHF